MKGKPIKTPIQPVRLNPPVKTSPTSLDASLKPVLPGQIPKERKDGRHVSAPSETE